MKKIEEKKKIVAIVLSVLAVVLFTNAFYTLEESQVSIITQFGEVVRTEKDAGLHFKIPFFHKVHKYTAKLLRLDGDPQKILTKEKQFIEVDTTSRWRISDIRKFYQSLVTYQAAFSRLSDIVDSSVRDVITINSLDDIVRSSNIISETSHKEKFEINSDDIKIDELSSEAVTYSKITKGRASLANEILKKANSQLDEFGIKVIDVIFKQIKYSDELQASVFSRMIKDRNQIAQTFRSTGEGKKAEWIGKLENEKKSILSKAYAEAERIKGDADARAASIYALSYKKDIDFYTFWKSMEMYRKSLISSEKILSTDMDYFRSLYAY